MKRLLFASLVNPKSRIFGPDDTVVGGAGDDTVVGGAGDDTVVGGVKDEPPPTNNKDEDKPTLSQKQVAKIVAEERKKYQEQIKKQVDQLEALKKNAGLTTKQKDELQNQIEELKTSMMTKEELAKRERERLQQEHKKALESTSQERDQWRTRYTTERISREITDAAKGAEAFNEHQFVPILAPNTRLVEIVDENGQGTGELVPQVRFREVKDGKPIVLDLSVTEAVKRMKEMPEYGNFFKSGTEGGLGKNNQAVPTGTVDYDKMTPEQYREHRKRLYGRTK